MPNTPENEYPAIPNFFFALDNAAESNYNIYSQGQKQGNSSSINATRTIAGEGVFAWVFLRISVSILASLQCPISLGGRNVR